MRKSMTMKTKLLSAFMALLGVVNANAQTMTGSVTTQPCNNDGVYSVTVTGLSAPISYTYYINGTSVTHSNVNSLTDQLVGFSSSNGWNQIYCYATRHIKKITGPGEGHGEVL